MIEAAIGAKVDNRIAKAILLFFLSLELLFEAYGKNLAMLAIAPAKVAAIVLIRISLCWI